MPSANVPGMSRAGGDIWNVVSTARTIRRFTDGPVDDVIRWRRALLGRISA